MNKSRLHHIEQCMKPGGNDRILVTLYYTDEPRRIAGMTLDGVRVPEAEWERTLEANKGAIRVNLRRTVVRGTL